MSRISSVATVVPRHQIGPNVAQQFCPGTIRKTLQDLLRQSRAFIDCIVGYLETSARFIRIMDDIVGGSKRKVD